MRKVEVMFYKINLARYRFAMRKISMLLVGVLLSLNVQAADIKVCGLSSIDGAEFSSDGSKVVTNGYNGPNTVIDSITGKKLFEVAGGGGTILRFSPDGTKI